jgi:hypothetical protein
MTYANVDSSTTGLREAFLPVKVLVACYVGLGLVGLGAAVLLRDHPQLVNSAVWIRDTAVVITSGLMYLIAERAARGKRSAFVRLRIASIVVPLAIALLIVLPDPFPVWMKVQQGVCALAVAGVAVLVNRPAVARRFARGRD